MTGAVFTSGGTDLNYGGSSSFYVASVPTGTTQVTVYMAKRRVVEDYMASYLSSVVNRRECHGTCFFSPATRHVTSLPSTKQKSSVISCRFQLGW